MSVRPHVLEFLSCGCVFASCAEIVAFVQERVDYPVASTGVSRVMGNLGWERFVEDGKVHFRQPGKGKD
jgi:hypothetical protein